MDELTQARFLARPDRLLERVKAEICAQAARRLPADDHAGEAVDDEGDVDHASMCLHVGDVTDPQPVRSRRVEVALDEVGGSLGAVSGRDRGEDLAAPGGASDPELTHQPLDGAARDLDAFAVERDPDLVGAVHLEVCLPHALDLGLEVFVLQSSLRRRSLLGGVIGGRSDRQDPAVGSTPHLILCSSMKSIITCVGGRAPPRRKPKLP